MKPVPKRVVGEIWVGDIGVNNDYLYRKELTNEQFIENPFNIDNNSKYNKFLRTGDLGKRTKDGEIIYYSRIYFQVKIHGQCNWIRINWGSN